MSYGEDVMKVNLLRDLYVLYERILEIAKVSVVTLNNLEKVIKVL